MESTRAEREAWVAALAGRTVACIASGPSLTAEDCETVRALGIPALVTNTTFRICPWATALVAFDRKWWSVYGDEVDASFSGRRVMVRANHRNDLPTRVLLKFRPFGNSGCAAISLAALAGARRAVLLGFDAQRAADGRTHWHGDHPPELSNARSIDLWPTRFVHVAHYAAAKGCEVINASRETALSCFPRATLGEALSGRIAEAAG